MFLTFLLERIRLLLVRIVTGIATRTQNTCKTEEDSSDPCCCPRGKEKPDGPLVPRGFKAEMLRVQKAPESALQVVGQCRSSPGDRPPELGMAAS